MEPCAWSSDCFLGFNSPVRPSDMSYNTLTQTIIQGKYNLAIKLLENQFHF